MELSNAPGCYVWNGFLLPDQTVTWTGECAGDLAQGQGTLKWVWDRGRGKETAEETGYLEAGKNRQGQWITRYENGAVSEGPHVEGKRHGQWIVRSADGAVHEGSYVEGKRHGRWVTQDPSGKREVVTFKNGKTTFTSVRSTSGDVIISSGISSPSGEARGRKSARPVQRMGSQRPAVDYDKVYYTYLLWLIRNWRSEPRIRGPKPTSKGPSRPSSCVPARRPASRPMSSSPRGSPTPTLGPPTPAT